LTGKTNIHSEQGKLTVQGETNVLNAKVKGWSSLSDCRPCSDLTDDLPADNDSPIRNTTYKLGLSTGNKRHRECQPYSGGACVERTSKHVSLAEAAKLLAASGVALSQGTTVTEMRPINLGPEAPQTSRQLNGTITASNIQMTGKEIARNTDSIADPESHAPASPVNPFNMIFRRHNFERASLTVRNYLSPSPVVDRHRCVRQAHYRHFCRWQKPYGVTGRTR